MRDFAVLHNVRSIADDDDDDDDGGRVVVMMVMMAGSCPALPRTGEGELLILILNILSLSQTPPVTPRHPP